MLDRVDSILHVCFKVPSVKPIRGNIRTFPVALLVDGFQWRANVLHDVQMGNYHDLAWVRQKMTKPRLFGLNNTF